MKSYPTVLSAFILSSSLGLGLTACSSSPSASQVLASAEQAVSQQSSVNFVDVTTVGTSNKVLTGILGPVNGQESLTVNGSPVLQVRILRVTAYVYGTNASILQSALGLSAAQASSHVNQWIQLSSTDQPFNSVAASMSISSAISVYYPPSKTVTQEPSTKVHGIELIPLTGAQTVSKTAAVVTTLFISPTTHLPGAATLVERSSSETVKKEAVFRQWGYSVTVPQPTSFVTYASITAG